MINRLRRKFVIVAMCSVLAVLAVVLSVVNVVNYINVADSADSVITVLAEGGGSFGDIHGKPVSPETPYETRYFTVVLDGEGKALAVNVEAIAAIGWKDAVTLAEELYAQGSEGGYYGNYRYGAAAKDLFTMYIFVDCTQKLTSFYNFLWASIAVGAASLALVLVLLIVFSGKVMKPFSESYAKQKRFITDASHEIKTPLTIIGADANVLEMQEGDNEWTADIKEQVKRLTSLTEELVFLARMDEESRTLNAVDFCLSDAVEETVQPFRAVALARGVELRCDISPRLTYCGDESMIRRLVSLLVDNALKYTDGDGIDIALQTSGNKLSFTVKNRASYLREEELGRLFDRFYSSDLSRNSETGGHGVGLSVAQAIAAAHKGKITARKEGEGVVFALSLPVN